MNTQAAGDYPQITSSSYGSSTTEYWPGHTTIDMQSADDLIRKTEQALFSQRPLRRHQQHIKEPTAETIDMSTRRIVKVFIADPHIDVPMDKALLHKGEEKWTDATNEELYFEIPIKDLLTAHNAERVKWLDKEATRKAGKDIFLEPVRIRDLKMVVVEIAKF